MIPGMLMVLPFANFMATFISWAKFRSAKPEQYAMVKNFEDSGMLLCDLAVVNEAGKRMFAEFAVIYRNGAEIVRRGTVKLPAGRSTLYVYGLTESAAVDTSTAYYDANAIFPQAYYDAMGY